MSYINRLWAPGRAERCQCLLRDNNTGFQSIDGNDADPGPVSVIAHSPDDAGGAVELTVLAEEENALDVR
eukprot:scaffold444_cov42-Cyclotella_meneghiniana.AAC.5